MEQVEPGRGVPEVSTTARVLAMAGVGAAAVAAAWLAVRFGAPLHGAALVQIPAVLAVLYAVRRRRGGRIRADGAMAVSRARGR